MRSDQLTKQQASELFDRVSPILLYLVKLRKRMVERRFDGDDALLQSVRDAESAVYELRQELHRLSCRDQTHDRRPQEKPR